MMAATPDFSSLLATVALGKIQCLETTTQRLGDIQVGKDLAYTTES